MRSDDVLLVAVVLGYLYLVPGMFCLMTVFDATTKHKSQRAHIGHAMVWPLALIIMATGVALMLLAAPFIAVIKGIESLRFEPAALPDPRTILRDR